MTAPGERSVLVRGEPCRVWEKGEGAPLGFLAGLGGLVSWPPFLDALAAERRVIVPSLPGFPGATGHDRLDTTLDWIAATLDVLEAAGLEGADLVGASVGGTLTAEVAAVSHASVRRLVLMAPLAAFDPELPIADPWAQRDDELPALLCAHPERLLEQLRRAEGVAPMDHAVLLMRASEAAARLLWPTCDTGLGARLYRVRAPTLVLWGAQDRVAPAAYAARFAAAIGSNARARVIEDAGHRIDVDAPAEAASAILEFLRE